MTEPPRPRPDRPAGGRVELEPGEVLVLAPGLEHALEAVRESAVLLTLAGPGRPAGDAGAD